MANSQGQSEGGCKASQNSGRRQEVCLGLHSQGWWAAGQEHPRPPVGQEGTDPCSSPLPPPPGAITACYQHQQPADTMVFQSKHADTRGNFRLNSASVSAPGPCSKHGKCLCRGEGAERCYSGLFSQPLAREYYCFLDWHCW